MTLQARTNPRSSAPQPSHEPDLSAPEGLRVSTLVSEAGESMALSYPWSRPPFLERLSDGEAAVVLLALAGHGNAAIARIRAASARTVANQLAAAYRKLGGASRARLGAIEVGEEPVRLRASDPWREVIEVVYWPETSEQMWLRRLAEAVRPALDRGLGVAAWTAHVEESGGMIQHVADVGMPALLLDRLLVAAREAPGFVTAFHGREFSSLRGHLCARDSAAWRGLRIIRACGARDLIALIARDGGRSVALGVLVRDGSQISVADHGHYTRVVEHLSAGLRLRNSASFQLEIGKELESPAHRERAWLRQAAIAVHTSGETEPLSSAGEVWSAFVQGKLRVRDRFDSADRRFLLLERREDEVHSPLTARQLRVLSMRTAGKSLKEIAHELRTSIPTASLDLSKALGALGLCHAHELKN